MYRNFYRLSRKPFEISPDPRFYFPTQRHDEALANLWYGIDKRKGFVVLTGEVGTGKTLIVRTLLDMLRRTKHHYAYIFNPMLPAADFLPYALQDFGLSVAGTRGQMLVEFNRFLIHLFRSGSTAALIVDEAHLLSWELLEEIRLLTNIETSEQKLLQIVLVGQTELDNRLQSEELRQLRQRIALRCTLDHLSAEEVRGYVIRRLQLAGAGTTADKIFSAKAMDRIIAYSHGIPRLVNTICESALISAYAKQSRMVQAEIVEEVAIDFHLSAEPERGPERKQESVQEADLANNSSFLQKLARLLQLLENDSDSNGVRQRDRQGAKVQ